MRPSDARAAIRALRVGAAAVNQADLLSVGQDGVRGRIEPELNRLGAGDVLHPILIEGDWGSGKSHSLAMIKALARAAGLGTAAVTFNARTAPLSHPNRIYPALAQTVEVDGVVGIRSLVRRFLQDSHLNARVSEFVRARTDVFGEALGDLHRAHSRGDLLLLGRSAAWSTLLGTDLTVRDDQGRKHGAIRRLQALAELIAHCGRGGLVVLGDELESLGQLWNSASRASAYNAIGALISTSSILWVFGAAGNFERMVTHDLNHGMADSWRVKDAGRFFLAQWRAGQVRRLRPAVLGPDDADHMARLVADLYEVGYGLERQRAETALAAVTRKWSGDPGRNPRRLARGLVETLDEVRGPPSQSEGPSCRR